MASELNKGFPQPYINAPTENTMLIKRVKLENAEIGSRPSAMPTNEKNDMTVKHVENGK